MAVYSTWVIRVRIDCIAEMREEQYKSGFNDGLLQVAKILLNKGFSVFEVSKATDLEIERIEELKNKLNN